MLKHIALIFVCAGFLVTAPVVTTVLHAQDEPADTSVADTSEAEQTEEGEEPAEEEEEAAPLGAPELGYAVDNIFLFFCAVLVLFMQAGFAMVEVGLNSSKNVVNILAKNLMDICVGVLLYFVIGYGIMYPGDAATNGYFGFAGVGVGTEGEAAPGNLYAQVDWLFQVAFAATAATIVSGAVAGRMKFEAYLVYSALLTGLIYPISGYWKWGGGWLDEMGFYDFAGSCVVHAVGGFAGLAGAIVLGPRLGRYSADGKAQAIPAHNLALSTLGVFILWIGWYGFNPGSYLVFSDQASVEGTMLVAANTTLAAAAGGVAAMFVGWGMFGKPDVTMGLNGVLGGLVGITANCDGFTNGIAILVGAVAGALVVLGIVMLDKLKIDDPVGAWPVHGLCGMWGCLVIGILPNSYGLNDAGNQYGNIAAQITGTITYCVWAFVTMFILFSVLKAIGILRVSAEEEEQGLDISEHGMQAYVH